MSFLETAGAFILNVLSKNEEVQKFEKDFVSASARWVRRWFLKEDDSAKYVLDADTEVPKEFVYDKLKKLIQNPEFEKELKEKLEQSQKAIIREKNIARKADIEGENVHIGDKTASDDGKWDRKNVVVGGKIKAKGDVHVGDG